MNVCINSLLNGRRWHVGVYDTNQLDVTHHVNTTYVQHTLSCLIQRRHEMGRGTETQASTLIRPTLSLL